MLLPIDNLFAQVSTASTVENKGTGCNYPEALLSSGFLSSAIMDGHKILSIESVVIPEV